MSRLYGERFKRDFVAQVLRSDRTLRGVAGDLGVPVSTGQRWVVKYSDEMSSDGGEPTLESLLEQSRGLEEEIQVLKKQVGGLEEDREILKEATRFLAAETRNPMSSSKRRS